MGLFSILHRKHDVPRPHFLSKKRQPAHSQSRQCRIERLETRELLSINPIQVGVVYVEDFTPEDEPTTFTTSGATGADLFEVGFAGGPSGTTLSSVTIDLGDASIFDTVSGGDGEDSAYQLKILESGGFTITAIYDENGNALDLNNLLLPDGSTSLKICFSNFDAGDKLVFTVDVDDAFPISQNCESAEFCSYTSGSGITVQGATVSAAFSVGGQTVSISNVSFTDRYAFTDPTLNASLPNNAYDNAAANRYQPSGYSLSTDVEDRNNATAGAVGNIALAEISGYVYYDVDNDGVKDTATDPREIGLVTTVTLLNSSGSPVSSLIATNSTDGSVVTISTAPQTTGSNGAYRYYVTAGTYGVSETQPADYIDGKDTRGSISGTDDKTNTANDQNDKFRGIVVAAGQQGINYNFGEVKPVTVSGHVYFDKTSDSTGIGNVIIKLAIRGEDGTYTVISTTHTNDDGYYEFTRDAGGTLLTAGTYKVIEDNETASSKAILKKYADGEDFAGTVGDDEIGNAGNDYIGGIALLGGQSAVDYDFHEHGVSISGRVFVDMDVFEDDYVEGTDIGIGGVTIYLTNSNGDVTSVETNADGTYEFVDLLVDTYKLEEDLDRAPLFGKKEDYVATKYFDGDDYLGSLSGTLGDDLIEEINLTEDAVDYNFTEILPATISGHVFQDGDTLTLEEGETFSNPSDYGYNGALTADDTRLGGVTLVLCDGSGVPIEYDGHQITAKTDANGAYAFYGIPVGDYTIVEMQPEGFISGVDTAGRVEDQSGDVDGLFDGVVINSYTIAGDPNIHNNYQVEILNVAAIDAKGSAIARISINPGDTGESYNFSEILINYESNPPPPGPPTQPPTWPPIMSPYAALPFIEYHSYSSPYSIVETVPRPMAGGSGGPGGYTWHLSVIDAGQPRHEGDGDGYVQYSDESPFSSISWSGGDMKQSQWVLADQDGKPIKKLHFGRRDAIPVTGKWDGSGVTFVGIFIDGQWFLDLDGDGLWDNTDLWAKLGKRGDQPVSGDWDGDGKTDIGIYGPTWIGDITAINVEPGLPDAGNPPKSRPKNVPPDAADAAVGWRTMKKESNGRMRSDVIDHVFQYGTKGDRAVTGDWNGDGINSIGIFRNGTWFLDLDGDGRWSDGDMAVEFGQQGDIPIVGDWTGDGISKLGVYRDGTFHLDTNNNRRIDAADKVFQLGSAGDRPVVGDWTGDGVDKVGIYQDGQVVEQQTAAAPTGSSVK